MVEIILGTVIHGDKIGRTIGFPTANLSYSSNTLWSSVFKVNVIVQWKLYSGMWVNAVWKDMFEVHIFDFDQDIYGETISIYVLKKIRNNKKFETLHHLAIQLKKDKKIIQELQLNILTFGSFDVVHEGHKYYLSEARKYGDCLITIIATDKNIQRIKWNLPLHNESHRAISVRNLQIANSVHIWSNDNPMKWITDFSPYSICLWYDQRWKFVEMLPKKVQELWLHIKIIKIPAFKPELYKSSLLKKKNTS